MNLIPKRKQNSTQALGDNISQSTLDQIVNMTIKRIADGVVTTAKIADLAVTNAKINDLSVTKLTAGNISVTGTLTSGGKFQTAASPNARIEISDTLIAGYSDATTKQFYLQASDGKAYCGGGVIILDTNGILIDATASTTLLRFKYNTQYTNLYSSNNAFNIDPAGGANFSINMGTPGNFLIDNVNHRITFPYTITDIFVNSAGGCNLGNASAYFNDISYKTITDRGCPAPMVSSALEAIKGMKTKKRKLTLEDAEREGMGSRAKQRIAKNEGGEFEELDLSTYPEEIVNIPTEKEHAHAKEFNRVAKIGLCTNELVYLHTKAIQELLARVELLETK